MAGERRHERFRDKDRSDGQALINRFRHEIFSGDVENVAAPGSVAAVIDKGRDYAALVDEYYEPAEPGLQGLVLVAWLINEHTADRIDDLADALREADTQLALAEDLEAALLEEAQTLEAQLRREVGAAMRRRGKPLPRQARGPAGSRRAVGQQLWRLARLATRNAVALALLPNFEIEWVTQAFDLSAELERRDKPSTSARAIRDRLMTLLVLEMRGVREAAAYLWRERRPEVEKLFNLKWSTPRRAPRPEPARPAVHSPHPVDETGTD